MLKLLTQVKDKDKIVLGKGFDVFSILENIFLKVDPNSLLPSDRVLIGLYKFKYYNYDPANVSNIISSIAETGTFKTSKGAVEAYIYAYILLLSNNLNKFTDLEVPTGKFLDQLEEIDPDLWDDDLGFSLGLTINFQGNFTERINSLIKNGNQIFKLNFYFGKKIREMWDKVSIDATSYKEAITISNQVFYSNEFSKVRKIPVLCFLNNIENKGQLTKEILGEITNTNFYSNLFGFIVSEDISDPSYYNFRSSLLFKLLVTFRLLGWDKLIMVPPNLVVQANKLQNLGKRASVMSSRFHIMELVIYSIISVFIGSFATYYILKVGGLKGFAIYSIPIALPIILPYINKKIKEKRNNGREDD